MVYLFLRGLLGAAGDCRELRSVAGQLHGQSRRRSGCGPLGQFALDDLVLERVVRHEDRPTVRSEQVEVAGNLVHPAPGEDGLGTLRQGYLEDSSVDPVKEITDLIEAQRGYELNSKVISAADQMLAATAQVR